MPGGRDVAEPLRRTPVDVHQDRHFGGGIAIGGEHLPGEGRGALDGEIDGLRLTVFDRDSFSGGIRGVIAIVRAVTFDHDIPRRDVQAELPFFVGGDAGEVFIQRCQTKHHTRGGLSRVLVDHAPGHRRQAGIEGGQCQTYAGRGLFGAKMDTGIVRPNPPLAILFTHLHEIRHVGVRHVVELVVALGVGAGRTGWRFRLRQVHQRHRHSRGNLAVGQDVYLAGKRDAGRRNRCGCGSYWRSGLQACQRQNDGGHQHQPREKCRASEGAAVSRGVQNAAEAGFQGRAAGHGQCGGLERGVAAETGGDGQQIVGIRAAARAGGQDQVVAGTLGFDGQAAAGQPCEGVKPEHHFGEAAEKKRQAIVPLYVGQFVQQDDTPALGGPGVGRHEDRRPPDAKGHGGAAAAGLQEGHAATDGEKGTEFREQGGPRLAHACRTIFQQAEHDHGDEHGQAHARHTGEPEAH